MKIALTSWQNRIAPVFDVAQKLLLLEVEAGQILKRSCATLPGQLPFQKVLRLVELEIEILICGAVSRPLLAMITGYGIKVIPFVAGDLITVTRAWLEGDLEKGKFHMPGCRNRGKIRHHAIGDTYKEGSAMNAQNRGGNGQSGGRRQGQGGRGGRRPGPGGFCVCPQCGQTEAHQQGVPCMDHKCPSCGATMTRQR